ncbi:MAG: 16S rRNA (guanine(966)-N(2))-methyltransferase RsmD [Planctomycetes bacterium]|nr:16S rRNA (guanine(966)-N(2))-methyltransferase RsmD [Planctomycetota bacterium]
MRIIAGSKRGMKLFSPKTDVSRPITDRVKESLFSMLYSYDLPSGKMIADLFCGVGSIGLEALSRGAEFVTFVEKDPEIASILKENIEKAGFANASKVKMTNAFRAGAPIGLQRKKYDLVFVDPPYPTTKDVQAESALSGLLNLLPEQLNEDGIVVVRTHKDVELLEEYGLLKVLQRRIWGTMAVTILNKKHT